MERKLIDEILLKRKGIKKPGLRVTLSRIKRRLDLRSIEQAACYYIKKNNININVSSIIDEITRSAVQRNIDIPHTKDTKRKEDIEGRIKRAKKRILKEYTKEPFVPSNIVSGMLNNLDIYPEIYLFENSVRLFITKVMEKKYGKEWWAKKVHATIQKKVGIRKLAEDEAPWHSRRNAEPIFYTDIDDLLKILNSYTSDYRSILGKKLEYVVIWIKEIKRTRNILAHNNPVSKKDRRRILVYAHDWRECAKRMKI